MLNTDTLFVGQTAIYLPTIDSTNAYAKELLTKNKPSAGTVIWAGQQTAGRGQVGSSWETAPFQNLTASFILHPNFLEVNQQFALNQAIALAIRDLLLSINLSNERVKIKWPNDIYVDTDKVAGVLIENVIEKSKIKHSIVGIGLNVNQSEFSPTLKNPTSLYQKTGKSFEITQLLSELCRFVEQRFLQLKAQKISELKAIYTQNLFRYQEVYNFQIAESQEVIQAQILGVSPAGKLIIQHEKQLREFGLKEIQFII